MSTQLKKKIIKLLEEDREFRYTVAGYLGLSEILENIEKIWQNISKIWEEIKAMRESQEKLWEEVKSLREGQEKLWEEVRALREGQNRLWEGQERLWEEVKALREGQNRLWDEVRALREGQNRLWDEVKALREGQERLWEGHSKLWEEVRNLKIAQEKTYRYMTSGFRELRTLLGSSFESYTAAFTELLLEEMGYPEARVGRKYLLYDREIVEVDLFCEKPLVVGEVTLNIRTLEEANREMDKLLKRIKIVEEIYKEKPVVTLLYVLKVAPEIIDTLRTMMEKHGIKIITSRDIEEEITP